MRISYGKKHVALLLSFALLFSIVSYLGPRAVYAAEGPNRFSNGSFELTDGNGNATGWTRHQYTGTVQFSVTDAVYAEGTYAHQLNSSLPTARASIRQIVWLDQEDIGKMFRLSFWMKTDDASGTGKTYVRYAFRNSSNQTIGANQFSRTVTGSRDWNLAEKEFEIPQGTVSISFEAFLENVDGTVWFDDMRFYELLPDVEPEGELLLNGGFERLTASVDWANGVGAANFRVWKPSGTPVFTADTGTVRSGTASVRIDGAPPNASRGAVFQRIETLEIGTPYLISGWYKTQDVSNTIHVRLQYQRDLGNGPVTTNVVLVNNVNGTNDWTYFSRVVTLPDNIVQPNAPVTTLEAFLENSTGTVWYDDFSIKQHVPLVDFSLDPQVVAIGEGADTQVDAAFTPENAANQTLIWTSSDPAVATVDASGRVYGHSTGYAVITAESTETSQRRSVVASIGIPPAVSLTVQPFVGTVQENGLLAGAFSAFDAGNAAITFAKATEPKHGHASVNADGTFRYIPIRGYTGADDFVFLAQTEAEGPLFGIVSIVVEPIERAPVLDLLWYSTDKGTPLVGTLERVLSPTTEPVTWTRTSAPESGGAATVQSNGSFTYTPPSGFIGYDRFRVAVSTAGGLPTEDTVHIFVVPAPTDFAANLDAVSGGNVHPRVLADADRFAHIRSLIATDPYMSDWVNDLKSVVDAFVAEPSTGPGTAILYQTALMYQLTEDPVYANRAIAHLMYMANDMPVSQWPGQFNNMLSLAPIANAVGLAYDWLYQEMTPTERQTIEAMVSEYIFSHALGWYRGQFTHNGERNNINFVNNGSFGVLALAMFRESGTIGAEAAEVLQGTYRKLQQALRYVSEDGGWPEGPHYWRYGTQPLYLYLAGLHSTLGTDYGLSELEGMEAIGEYPLHLHGPGGTFNFGDDDNAPVPSPQSLWLADFYQRPELAWYAGQLYREHQISSPLYLLFYEPGMFDTQPTALDRAFHGPEMIAMRSSWADPNGTYAAMRGLDEALLSHNDLDAGSFIFDALGERWALDIGNENYSLPGYWQLSGEGTRWTYYRKGLQGHNTIVINPHSNPVHMQDHAARAPLTRSESKPRGAFGIVDLTERYPNDAVSYRRGLMLTGERKQLIVQDELTLNASSELYWFMHTEASISVIENGRAAILSRKDKKLYVKMLEAPVGAVFSAMPAAPLPGLPNPPGQRINYGVNKLSIHATGIEQANIAVWLVPLTEEEPLPQQSPLFVPMESWSIPDGALPAAAPLPTVQSVTVNGVPIEGFRPTMTYYEYVIPFEVTDVPTVAAVSEHATTLSAAQSLPGRTLIYVADPQQPERINRYTVAFVLGPILGDPPAINRLPVTGVTASASPQANLGYTPEKTLDGDLNSRWTSEGHQWIQYDLGQAREVGAVSIAFFNGHTRLAYFNIETSLDGMNWSLAYPSGSSSGLSSEPEVFHFASAAQARYVRINGFGNSASLWNNYTEVGIFSPTPISVRIDAPAVWKPGDQRKLTASYTFADGRVVAAAPAGVEITTSNTTVLAFLPNGKALAKKPGTAVLTVTDNVYGLSRTQQIEVRTPNH
ncbi:discoidin domain-containing protein [Paenibacillus koleovorans]|uniref:discoidin domain-containing protein n=1 Tax=Paenibacillus koleovorans TaxID=121608 RepID=UPI000FDAF3AF|nr:Ig-like domain-containing protein [Paenibacillus koleovorans]